MNKKTANEQEVKKFSDMASEWWDPNGKFSPLHKFNPVRQEYLINRISSHFSLSLDKNFSFSNLTLLDIGCGGGLVCEPFARLGAQVTRIDASKNNIEVAKVHAQKTRFLEGFGVKLGAKLGAKLRVSWIKNRYKNEV